MTQHEENVIAAFRELCAEQEGASPVEVCRRLEEKQQMPALDSVIDVERTMRKLRDHGAL